MLGLFCFVVIFFSFFLGGDGGVDCLQDKTDFQGI